MTTFYFTTYVKLEDVFRHIVAEEGMKITNRLGPYQNEVSFIIESKISVPINDLHNLLGTKLNQYLDSIKALKDESNAGR